MRTKLANLAIIAVFFLIAAAGINAETFTANISSKQEVPTNASTATGIGRVFLDEGAGMVTFEVTFSGLSSSQTGAHIHAPGVVGANGGVIITLGTPGGTSGTITGSAAITAGQIADLRAHRAYINIHSSNFPGGEIRGQLAPKRPIDYDGDGKTDFSILRFPGGSPNQITYWNRNSQGPASNQTIPFGNAATDFPAPGDYDGDGKDDLALYRAGATAGAQSFFLIFRSSDNTTQFLPWGVMGDQTVARDYDGDGITDAAIFRRGATSGATTDWWILQSSDGMARNVKFGLTGNGTNQFDSAIPGDYDGDGKFDIAVYRFGVSPANTSIVLRSSDSGVTYDTFGNFQTDYIVPGDFDGDGKWEIAAARTGATGAAQLNWWIRQSSDGAVSVTPFGISSDIPTQGDYDGDGVTDISVWRPNDGGGNSRYYAISSFDGTFIFSQWGISSDFSVNRFDTR